MHNFIDKRGRSIQIEVDYDAHAFYEGKKVGDVLTTGPREVGRNMPDLPPQITGWEVEKDFQSAGICTEMVRLLAELWGPLEPAHKNVGIGDVNALTDSGMAITRKCQALGYILGFEDERPLRHLGYNV